MDLSSGFAQLKAAIDHGDIEVAGHLGNQLLVTARSSCEPDEAARALNYLALLAFQRSDYERCIALASESVDIIEKHGNDGILCDALGALASANACQMNFEAAVDLGLDAVEAGRRTASPARLATAINNLACVLGEAGDIEDACELLQEAAREIALGGGGKIEATIAANHLWLDWMRCLAALDSGASTGDFDDAVCDRLNAALGLVESHGRTGGHSHGMCHIVGTYFHVWSGRHQTAAHHLAQGLAIALRIGNQPLLAMAHGAEAELEASMGDFEKALEASVRSVQCAQTSGEGPLILKCRSLRAQLLMRAGRAPEAASEYRILLAHQRRVLTRTTESRARVAQLKRAADKAVQLAEDRAAQDALTGLPTRRALERLWQRLTDAGLPADAHVSVALLDVNDFKSINDTLGHAAGDLALQKVADALRISIRKTDIALRLAGDEFVVVMPCATAAEAQLTVARIHAVLEHQDWSSVGSSVTVSIGVADSLLCDSTFEEILSRADSAMYSAKRSRRAAQVATISVA